MSRYITKDVSKAVEKARQQFADDEARDHRRRAAVTLPEPENKFTCTRCGRYLPLEEDSGDKLCNGCASVDVWGFHVFDGGAMGDYKCVHCHLSVIAPRHQVET
jgi:DNA-directed RNA polymerase subunit RPC12/RpoP